MMLKTRFELFSGELIKKRAKTLFFDIFLFCAERLHRRMVYLQRQKINGLRSRRRDDIMAGAD